MAITVKTKTSEAKIYELPEQCPKCQTHIVPEILYGYEYQIETPYKRILEVFFHCTNRRCKTSFIGQYFKSNSRSKDEYIFFKITSFNNSKVISFNETIKDISDDFVKIYNQSYLAEQFGSFEICGIGYRKALEYLIKDYLIKYKQIDRGTIEKKRLGNCILDHIEDGRIKNVAKRAAWLGNDEAHYIRKWMNKDFTDLKTLISLTVHWIMMEIMSKDYEIYMPDPK